ncbi:14613_t:CDS:2 [Gigaspora rosea]|nr:14613_t:CDS:2 [Gigaspora rosea]
MLDRLFGIVEELPKVHTKAKMNITKAQFYWNKKHKKVWQIFQENEMILLYNVARDKQGRPAPKKNKNNSQNNKRTSRSKISSPGGLIFARAHN